MDFATISTDLVPVSLFGRTGATPAGGVAWAERVLKHIETIVKKTWTRFLPSHELLRKSKKKLKKYAPKGPGAPLPEIMNPRSHLRKIPKTDKILTGKLVPMGFLSFEHFS